jgi:hypothetical protein
VYHFGIMGTNPAPAPESPPPPQLIAAPTSPQLSFVDAEVHYRELIAFFKHLVWITGVALGLIVLVGGYIFRSNLQDTLHDAEQKATKTVSDTVDTRVNQAFEDKNINARIEAAAKDKIGTITDRMIEQQLTSKLQPIEQRILLIGRISECEARIHAGFRSAWEELVGIAGSTRDPTALQFAKSTLVSTSEGYDTYWQAEMKPHVGMKPLDFLKMQQFQARGPGERQASNLRDVVQVIHDDQNLNLVAIAFIAFRDLSGEKVKMFDFAAVKSWCAKNQPKCSQ